MYIQEKVAWDGEVDQKLALLNTLGVDCIAIDMPDAKREESGETSEAPVAAAEEAAAPTEEIQADEA